MTNLIFTAILTVSSYYSITYISTGGNNMKNAIKTAHLIGLGAIGSVYASIIHQYNDKCIKVILDSERLERYRNGTVINGKRYFFDLTVPRAGDEPAELILIAVKGHHLKEAIKSITPLVGQDTIIISLLNGITSEDYLSRAFGPEKILHGFCVGTDAVRENNEVIFHNAGKIVFGEHYPEVKGKAEPVAGFFTRTGVPFWVPDNIRRQMWWKFMMNVGINQTSAILRAPYGVYQKTPEARELMASACREVILLAEKEGVSLSESDITEYMDYINVLSPDGKTSMLQDMEAGRKTEVESFALTVINLGKKHGIPVPVNEMLYRMIRVLEQNKKEGG
jgi:2-dehydropantoate 2-reductase